MNEVLTEIKPKLGFIGVGWIGRNRLEAIAICGSTEIKAIPNTNVAYMEEACALAPGSALVTSMDEMAEGELDGIIITTPSALHATQSIAAINKGKAVFY